LRVCRTIRFAQPVVEVGYEYVDVGAAIAGHSTHRKIALLFPTLDGAFVPLNIVGDFLPALKNLSAGSIQGAPHRDSLKFDLGKNSTRIALQAMN
jgi:hypothetical protein